MAIKSPNFLNISFGDGTIFPYLKAKKSPNTLQIYYIDGKIFDALLGGDETNKKLNPNSFDFFVVDSIFPYLRGKQSLVNMDVFGVDSIVPAILYDLPAETPQPPAPSLTVIRRRIFLCD